MLRDLEPGALAGDLPLDQDPALLPAVLATLAVGVIVLDTTGRFVLCNAAAERILGLTRSEIESRQPTTPEWKPIHEDGTPWPGDEHPVSVTLRTGESVAGEIMGVQRGDDTRVWLRVSAVPLRDPATGAVRAAIATFSDVTRVIEERHALHARSRAFSEILDGAQAITVQIDLRDGTAHFSDSYARILGFDLDEIPTRIDQRSGNVHPDDAGKLWRALASLDEDATFQYDQRSRRKNGEWLWLRVRGKVVERDADGKPVRIAGTQTNIQEEKLAGLDALEREAQLKAFFDSPVVGVAMVGPDDRFERVNATFCDMLGYSATELRSLSWRDLTTDEDLRTLERLSAELAQGLRDGFSVEKHCRRKDGALLRALASFSLVKREADGRLHRLVLLAEMSPRTVPAVTAPSTGTPRGRTLPEFISQCMHCKKVKSDDARWKDLARYLLDHTDTRVSHGICPDCVARFYRDYTS